MAEPQDREGGPTAPLADLPEELVCNIAVKLGCDDFCAFRLTCNAIHAKSFHEFAMEYFSTKCFMFTTESLKVLVGIAEHGRLRKYLQRVIFTTALFTDLVFSCPNGCKCVWKPTVRQAEAIRGYVEDQRTLKDSGADKRMLVEALKHLGSVDAVTVVDAVSKVPLGIDYRGENKVRRKTGGCGPVYSKSPSADEAGYDRWQSHVWKVVIESVAEAAVSVTRFAAAVDRGISADDLKLSRHTRRSLTRSFKHLGRLRMHLNSDRLTEKKARAVRDFAATLGGVTELQLHYDSHIDTGLNAAVMHNIFVQHLDLAKLTSITLENLFINLPTLVKTISRLTSATKFFFKFINLSSGSWPTILKLLQQKIPALDSLHLMYLQEAGRKVYFLHQLEQDDEDQDLPLPFDDVPEWIENGDDYLDLEEYETESESEAIDDDDDSLPDLEPGPSSGKTADERPTVGADDQMTSSGGKTSDPDRIGMQPKIEHPDIPDHKAPGHDEFAERGYYICLDDKDEIARQFPVFIAEYNVGESLADHQDPFDFLPHPPAGGNFNNFVNGLAAVFGMPPGAGPQPPAAAVAAAAGANVNHAAHAPPPPPPAQNTADAAGGANQWAEDGWSSARQDHGDGWDANAAAEGWMNGPVEAESEAMPAECDVRNKTFEHGSNVD